MNYQSPGPERGTYFLFLIALGTGSGVHPASSYPACTRSLSPEVKRPGREADHAPLLTPRLIMREPMTVAARSMHQLSSPARKLGS
jgi:hypothetical protein